MPIREPPVLLGTQYELRHVGPRAAVFPNAIMANATVLQRTDMVSRPLPMSDVPSSPDFVSGTYILRILDSGEGTLLFPNKNASDGVPWRNRFDPGGHLQFVEIYLNGNLEFVGVVDQVIASQQQVQVHLSDGWTLLKKAYERDWTTTSAPHDVAERAGRVWRPIIVDGFAYVGSTTPAAQWTVTTSFGTATLRTTGGLALSVQARGAAFAQIQSANIACQSAIWAAEANAFQPPTGTTGMSLRIFENGSEAYTIQIIGGSVTFTQWDPVGLSATNGSTLTPTATTTYALRLESDGMFVFGYVNGQLIGCFRRPPESPNTLGAVINLTSNGQADSCVVTSALLEAQVPLLSQTVTGPVTATGPAGAGSDVAFGTVTWTSPNNIAVPASHASISFTTLSQVSDYLLASNFGFSVPSNATITGVRVTMLRVATGAGVITDDVVSLYSGGVIGTNHAYGAGWPAGPIWQEYGSAADLWGATLTPAIVNGSGFGVVLAGIYTTASGTTTATVAYPITMSVFYTLPAADPGDYVLPGNASTYPWGGLHGRYFNDADIQGASPPSFYSMAILAPPRSTAYGASSPPEYSERQDATINFPNTATPTWAPTPGVSLVPGSSGQVNFSVKWFGAIWLQFATSGTYTFSFTVDDGVRVWIGKTRWGEQIIEGQWIYGGAAIAYTATLAKIGNVAQDGWYPIVIEYWQGGASAAAVFQFHPAIGYTDPGGTAITTSLQVVPATSLSPLGCVDQRFQAISHYDLMSQALSAAGYQATCVPERLESGVFPGKAVARLQQGQQTDIILQPADLPRDAGEGILNYSSTLDTTDFAASLQGNGAGAATGTTGQMQADVFDASTMQSSLFDVQAWQDFSDASFPELLEALLNARLGLQLAPWQLLSADPVGKPRQAFTWPLPGSLAAMRWAAGDSMRIHAREINVYDVTPRQMLVVTRNILPYGIASTQATFANRPRNPAHTARQAQFTATRVQRNRQRTQVTLTGLYQQNITIAGNSGAPVYSLVTLSAADTVVDASLRVAAALTGTTPVFGVEINGTDETIALGGPWTTIPTSIPFTSLAVPAANDSRVYVRLTNRTANPISNVDFQIFVDVLR